ncbi:eukaryotic translation initiation factor 2-alpha kinase 1 isoform X1 [Scyliorhinus canicula]|uniref:eukaryotic translation initiation factor 2-alpha kinase 1 isoform X1 n=3 Tax=Scyliorhinus canicula TaxID=7830 RepID=UPI0018F49444|nr:eukaryotic translation initiation factor 2-alpha kinase 1 isoform X1 [Scyliorhinus canicula]
MQSGGNITRRSHDLGSGVFTPPSSSDDLQQPRAKLTFSFPQEAPATFDESDLMQECGLDCNRTVPTLMDFTVAIPNQLLLVSLLEHLCLVYEQNPQRSMSLFKLLCQKLAGMHLISPITFSDEFSTVRLQHNQAFTNLLQAASNGLYRQRPATNGDAAAPVSCRTKETLFHEQTSRYLSEFEEIGRLGRGSYGKVYKVRNKLDRQLYAIKKILMKKITRYDCMKVLREVKVLAGLQHTHIVGYHTAWMEHVQQQPPKNNQMPLSNLCALMGPSGQEECRDSFVQNTQTSGSSIVFADTGSVSRVAETLSSSNLVEEEMGKNISNGNYNNIFFHDGDHGTSHLNNGRCQSPALLPGTKSLQVYSPFSFSKNPSYESQMPQVVRNKLGPLIEVMETEAEDLERDEGRVTNTIEEISGSSAYSTNDSSPEDGSSFTDVHPESKIHFHLMLHIQMQLCERSLQDWILDRNTRPGEGPSLICAFSLVEPDCTIHIFRQLLEGVCFIHSKGVMHRDLKPRNIFLHGSDYHVRIGDFGLACNDIIAETSDQWPAPTKVTDSKHTTGVGTCLYASPEQLRGSTYDFKSDMYSVGIILLELFQPFRTVMEKIKTLTALRECHIPGDFTQRWPVHAKYVKRLTSGIAACRPSADEMLASELFHNSPEVTTPQDNLEQRLVTQEQEIKILQWKVIKQEDEIKNLKEKIKLLSGEGEPS